MLKTIDEKEEDELEAEVKNDTKPSFCDLLPEKGPCEVRKICAEKQCKHINSNFLWEEIRVFARANLGYFSVVLF